MPQRKMICGNLAQRSLPLQSTEGIWMNEVSCKPRLGAVTRNVDIGEPINYNM